MPGISQKLVLRFVPIRRKCERSTAQYSQQCLKALKTISLTPTVICICYFLHNADMPRAEVLSDNLCNFINKFLFCFVFLFLHTLIIKTNLDLGLLHAYSKLTELLLPKQLIGMLKLVEKKKRNDPQCYNNISPAVGTRF